jgi:hypothetical protein
MNTPPTTKETYLAGDGEQPVGRAEVERRRRMYHEALAVVAVKGQQLEKAYSNSPEVVATRLVPLRDQAELHRVFFEAARDVHDEQERRAAAEDATRIARMNVNIANAQLKAAEAQADAAASQAQAAQDAVEYAKTSAEASQAQVGASERLVTLTAAQSHAAKRSVFVAIVVAIVLVAQTLLFAAQALFLREQVRLMKVQAGQASHAEIHEP